MKHLKSISHFLNEAYQIDKWEVPFTNANDFSQEVVEQVNNLYGEILPYIDEVLEKHNIFPSSIFFFNGYFAHDYKKRDVTFFNDMIYNQRSNTPDNEVSMIKGIMVTNLNKEQILGLINEPKETFDYIIERLKDEDVDNILTEDKLKRFEDTKEDQRMEFCFCPFWGYQPIKIEDLWRKGKDYSIRFTLDVKN